MKASWWFAPWKVNSSCDGYLHLTFQLYFRMFLFLLLAFCSAQKAIRVVQTAQFTSDRLSEKGHIFFEEKPPSSDTLVILEPSQQFQKVFIIRHLP
jgi:hypothetical protein